MVLCSIVVNKIRLVIVLYNPSLKLEWKPHPLVIFASYNSTPC